MTIAGFHTKHELGDLVAALDGQVQTMIGAIRSGFDAWNRASPGAAGAWKARWEVFYPRWVAAVAEARDASQPLISADVETAEPDYLALQAAFHGAFDGDPFGFPALDRDLRAKAGAGGAVAAPTYDVAQPTAPDADLAGFQAADSAAKALEKVAAGATSPKTLIVAGLALAVGLGLVLKVAK